MKTLLKNAEIFINDNLVKEDILIENGLIIDISEDIGISQDYNIIDFSGKIIVPGLIDLHAHICSSVQEIEKSLKIGTESAVKGGFTTVCVMSDTNPPLDNEGIFDRVTC